MEIEGGRQGVSGCWGGTLGTLGTYLPTLGVLAVVGKAVRDEPVDLAERQHLLL